MIKTTIVHYWLKGMRGGEKVIESIVDIFPNSEIITNVYIKDNISDELSKRVKKTTLIQFLPKSLKFYQYYLPLYPLALSKIKINSVDLVISSESGPAKGINVSRKIPHICYTHTPMRYIWDMQDEYFGNGLKRKTIQPIISFLQKWDCSTAQKVDYIIANSNFVKNRIKRIWNRESIVIHPPVDTDRFKMNQTVDDFYLLFGQHVKYKKSELAIRVFNENGRKLIVMGGGEELPFLKSIAKDNIVFFGCVDDETKNKYLSSCRALIFPGVEDFGIIPVEAMACGRPVIAFNRGGATETVKNKVSGLFFDTQTEKSLNAVINKYESVEDQFIPSKIREYSIRFDRKVFQEKFKEYVKFCLDDFHKTGFSKRR